jgi:hypothetical protein
MSRWGTTRAKSGRLRVKKRDKAGREYLGQNEVIVSAGMYSAREMERELQRAADESSEPVVDLEVDAYSSREVPAIETPTRVLSSQTQWGGFQEAGFLPESPLLRRIKTRREQHDDPGELGSAESGQ